MPGSKGGSNGCGMHKISHVASDVCAQALACRVCYTACWEHWRAWQGCHMNLMQAGPVSAVLSLKYLCLHLFF